jgi:D-alanyl-D-alanine endopeptidase (penicillin-binding protein 7)
MKSFAEHLGTTMKTMLKVSLTALLSSALIVGAYSTSISTSTANTDASSECKSKKVAKKATKKSSHKARKHSSRKHSSPRVSRYGKYRVKATRLSLAERQRNEALARLPHRVGPIDIFQNPEAQKGLSLESRAAVVMNAETGEVLYSKNSTRKMPIASITKLMTAMVILDAHLPMDEYITISNADIDYLKHTTSHLGVGTTLTRRELMLLALMSSENRAASALARSYPGGTSAAIAAMNRKALDIGMRNAVFLDGTGLHSENSASPQDLVKMVSAAHHYPEIKQFSTTTEYTARIAKGIHTFRNTNALVRDSNSNWNIEVSKTGFINEAGKCLVMQAKINTTPVVIILMDSSGRFTRIGDANRIKNWLESAFSFKS